MGVTPQPPASSPGHEGPLENNGSKFCFLTGPYGGPIATPCLLDSLTAPYAGMPPESDG
jgi:hypothetical protein